MLRLKPLRRLIPKCILEPPTLFVPTLSILSLAGSLLMHRSGRGVLANRIMQYLLAYGSIPVLTESIDAMVEEDIGEADHPAMLSMEFGT